jgi:hypothetical protein
MRQRVYEKVKYLGENRNCQRRSFMTTPGGAGRVLRFRSTTWY